MEHTPHLSRARALANGMSQSAASSYVARQELLRARGSRPIYSLKHLALCCDTDWAYLRGVVSRRSYAAYRYFRIPKRTGGYRNLQSPSDALMAVQRWILHEILDTLPRHPDNFAYFANVTTRDCAERHSGAKWMIKTDLHNYFPSILERRVYRVFEGMGYSPLLSFELARICTWPRTRGSVGKSDSGSLPYSRHSEGVLPQGAPTSGALSNAVTWALDCALSKFASRNSLIYTRYSDDMAFSSCEKFDRERAAYLASQIGKIVTSMGLSVHERKTRIIPPGARMNLLGMLITDDGVGILPEQRRLVKLYLHAVDRYGPVEFARVRKFDSVLSFINHVYGWLAYLSLIDPLWAGERRNEWEKTLAKHNVFPLVMN